VRTRYVCVVVSVLVGLTAGCTGDGGGTAPTSAGTSPSTGRSSPTGPASASLTSPSMAPITVDAALQRYEQYLHALGREDVGTLCDIAARAVKKAEEKGFGPCATTFPIMLGMTRRRTNSSALQERWVPLADFDVGARSPPMVFYTQETPRLHSAMRLR
jgi:hypothetical protein